MKIIRSNCCGKMLTKRCADCPVWREREKAIAQVGNAMDPNWAHEALHSADRVMRLHGTFTTDDIWFDLANRAVIEPHERRAMGPITRMLLKSGEVKIIDYTTSVRPVCHGRRIPVYRVLW